MLALSLGLAAPHLSRSAPVADEVALVQHESRVDRQATLLQAHQTRFKGSLSLESGTIPEEKCQELPAACEAPFNCRRKTHKSMFKDMTQTTNGHPNPNAWCHTPYLQFAIQCIKEKNMLKAAHTLWNAQNEKTRDMDAQYCFAAGHCNMTSINETKYRAFNRSTITENTTMEEMEAHCNNLYGDVWKHKAILDFFHANADGMGKNNEYAHMACAMGNWHCDVTYCREFYCYDEHWKKTYGYKANPGARVEAAPRHHHSRKK